MMKIIANELDDAVLISRDGKVFYYSNESLVSGSPEWFPILVYGLHFVEDNNKIKLYRDFFSFNHYGKYSSEHDTADDIRRLDI